jgi:hypothetical protein
MNGACIWPRLTRFGILKLTVINDALIVSFKEL